MSKLIAILFFIPLKSFSQTDSIYFKTNAEIGVVRYVIQTSSDTLTWSRLDTISPKKKLLNEYTYPIKIKNIYYRVRAIMQQGNYYTFALAYFNKPPTLNIYPNTFNKTLSN